MRCLDCQTDNKDYAHTCVGCGVSLQAARAWMYLDRAEIGIHKSRLHVAAENMTRADIEMLTLGAEQRSHYLLTARAFYLQGVIYFNRGLNDKAEAEFLLAAANLQARPQGHELLANVFNRLGGISYYNSDMEKAHDYYLRSRDLAANIGAAAVAARASTNLGNVAIVQGDTEQAVAHYNYALDQAQVSGDPTAIAQACRVLAQLYADIGPYKYAFNYAAQSLELCEQVENLDVRSLILSDAANIYLRAGEIRAADDCLRRAIGLVRHVESNIAAQSITVRMAELRRQQGDNEGWFSYASRAFNDKSDKIMFRNEMGLQLANYYIAQQDWLSAHRHLQTLLAMVSSSGDEEDALLHRACALLYAAVDEWDVAEECFKKAFITEMLCYDLASTWQEYGTVVLRRALVDDTFYAEASFAFAQATKLFHKLNLPNRLAQIEALQHQLPANDVAPNWMNEAAILPT